MNFCNGGINKIVLLLRKGVSPYEYMDSWGRFDETLADKEAFYSNLNMKDITDVDYRHAKRVFKSLNNKNLGDYHDLYVQSDHYYLQIYLKILEKCVDCKSCLDYMKTKDEKLILRCFSCKKNYEKDFNKELIKRFANTYNFKLLADVFENFRNMCIKVYELDPAHFLSVPGLA